MFLGFLWDESANAKDFLNECSKEERDKFFYKYTSHMKMGVEKVNIPKMLDIGNVSYDMGYFND